MTQLWSSIRVRWRVLVLALAVGVGVAGGLGTFTFGYAKGWSYLSADPAACNNCHIMRPQYESWQKSSHHTVATCAQCHLPSSFVPKYLAKALNGWHHSKAFTLGGFDEPIRIKEPNAAILQQQCLECHGALTHAMRAGGEPLRCTHCHARAGHGEPAGVGPPLSEKE